MCVQFAFVFLKSNFIFSKKRSKVFYFEGPLKPVGVVVHVVFFSSNNSIVAVDSDFHGSLQELYLHGKYQSCDLIYYILLIPFICDRKLAKRLKLQFCP